jgi:CRISPR-associated endonuclease/helicase Cas3
VSTQVVEVSIDISFDLMITECAPLDAMIQRFGRINRKRNEKAIGIKKPIYVLAPPENEKEARPYDLQILKQSYESLPDSKPLREREIQKKIDTVFTDINFLKIEEHAVFKEGGTWSISPLMNGHAWLVEILEIDSVVCIKQADIEKYVESSYKERMELEIPSRYFPVRHLERLKAGNIPFVIPNVAYDDEIGLIQDKLKEESFDSNNQFI